MGEEEPAADAPGKGRRAAVGVEGAWPVLFRTMGVLGFVLPQRHRSGLYRIAWIRVIPMLIVVAVMLWYLCTYRVTYTNNSYDVYVDLFPAVTCMIVLVCNFALAIRKRRETCGLLKGLDGALKPSPVWMSIAFSALFVMDIAMFNFVNYVFYAGTYSSLVECVISTLIYPAFPLLLDLHVMHLIRALNQVYAATLSRVPDQGNSRLGTRYPYAEAEDSECSKCPSGSVFVVQVMVWLNLSRFSFF